MDTGADHGRIPTPTRRDQLRRRQFLQRGGLIAVGLAALPILAACGSNLPTPAPSAAPGGATGGSTAPSTGASAGASAAASAAPAVTATPAPTPTVIASIPRAKSSAKVTGKLQFIQYQDFHPDHNAFIRAEAQEFAKSQGWNFDISYAAGFQGSGDLLTTLIGAVQAGNAPDVMFHDIGTYQYQSQGVFEKVTDITKELTDKYGETYPGYRDNTFYNDDWWGVPFYGRAGGLYVRKDMLEKAGVDLTKDLDTYDKLRDVALKVSNPDAKVWGWGFSINRGGDGTTGVQQPLIRYGSRVQDESGKKIIFNSPETIAGVKWLKETYSDPKWAKMLPPGINSWTDPSNNEAMLAGTIAMTDNAGTVFAKAVYDKVSFADQIVFVPRPKRISDGKVLDALSGARFHVIKGTKNKDAVYDVIRHFLSDPVMNQLLVTSPGYVLPPFRNAWKSDLVQKYPNAKNSEPLAYPTTSFTGLRDPGPPSPAIDTIVQGTYYTDMMAEVLQGKSPEDAVKSYHDRFIQIYKDFGIQVS